jgi:hypothetical protein
MPEGLHLPLSRNILPATLLVFKDFRKGKKPLLFPSRVWIGTKSLSATSGGNRYSSPFEPHGVLLVKRIFLYWKNSPSKYKLFEEWADQYKRKPLKVTDLGIVYNVSKQELKNRSGFRYEKK